MQVLKKKLPIKVCPWGNRIKTSLIKVTAKGRKFAKFKLNLYKYL